MRSKKPFVSWQPVLRIATQKKRLMKAVGAHMLCSCGYMQDGGLYFYIKDYQGNVRVVLNQRMLDCEGDEVQDIKKAIKVEWYIRQM